MANRFPLIVNPDTKEIQELKLNDNLDLTGNGIYAGGTVGNNGQVLTSNGTTVEWRTVTGGGGGGGGLDLNTTYIIETEEEPDGANLSLVAGGTGIGTIRIKFLDSDQLKFDAPDNLTLAPSIKDNSITNNKLLNSSFTVNIDGVNQNISLGGSFIIPSYGNVYTTAPQVLSNKTLSNCSISGSTNTITSIPNSSLVNSSITINNTPVSLGGSITLSGGGGTVVNYLLETDDGQSTNEKVIRLSGSDSSQSQTTLRGGNNVTLSRNGDVITIDSSFTDTNTDTTYSINIDSLISNSQNVGSRLNLVGGGNGSGNGITDTVNFRNGTGVVVSSDNANDITFSIGQNVSSTSNVTFNNLTLTGSLTVAGALTYVNTTNLVVTDKTITIADGVTNSTLANGAGILLGTSNINLIYSHDNTAWQSTANFDLVPTKSYKIGGTEVLTSTRILGKTSPSGDFVGTSDYQSLTNKTIINPVISQIINTGTLTLPAPTVADTLVGRATQDILTNKTISGSTNTITNIGNSSLTNSTITINDQSVSLGGSIVVTATDPYSDEKAQDAVAGSFTNGVHSGISFTYDDVTGRINATVTGGGGGGIAEVVSDTTPQLGGNLDLNGFNITGSGTISCSGFNSSPTGIILGSSAGSYDISFSQNTGVSPIIRNSVDGDTGIKILGAYNFGSSYALDVHLGTSGQSSKFKNLQPFADSLYSLGTSSVKWSNIHTANVTTEAVKLSTNNATILGTAGTAGEIKQIAGAPFWYDGSEWREFFLINSTAVTQTADTDWDNTIFRATFDDDFTDARFGVTPSYSSGASITAAAVKVGTSSLRLQNQYLKYPHRAEYDFTGEWTIEGWFYWDTLPASVGSSGDCIFSKYNPVYTSSNFMIGAESAVNGYVNFYWKNNASSAHNGSSGTVIAQYNNTDILQRWNHIAVVREPLDGSIHFYLNGAEHGSTVSNNIIDNDIPNSADHDLAIGYYQSASDSRNFDGYVDDFRISTVARYTSNFTAPTTALPVTGSTTTVILPPTNKSGVITLGATPTWRGTSGVTVTQQSSGNYRLTFSSSYTNADDYYVMTSVMDTGSANNTFVVTNRTTTHVDFIIKEGNNFIDTADVAIQIINHD